MWSDGLTKRQAEILEMINDCVTRNGFAPSIREIADAFQISSPNGVVCHLKALEKKGFLSRRKTKSRAIELSQDYLQQVRGMPVKGEIAAGTMREEADCSRRIDLGSLFDPDQNYALKVVGDSMIEAHICDGDLVVVQPASSATPGQIVVVRSSSGQTIVRHWSTEHAAALSSSAQRQSLQGSVGLLTAAEPQIVGIVVGVVRRAA